LLSAWGVYGVCQADWVLPGMACALAVYRWLRPGEPAALELRFSIGWIAAAAICCGLGAVWRVIVPAPYEAVVVFDALVWLQAGAVISGVGLFWRGAAGGAPGQLCRLTAWATVATAANVPITPPVQVVLGLFLCVCLAVLVRRQAALGAGSVRWPATALFCLFSVVGGLLVVGQVRKIDKALSHFYVNLRRFPGLTVPIGNQSRLKLGGPGPSGKDMGAVMEVQREAEQVLYLRNQVLHTFRGGAWLPSLGRHTAFSELRAGRVRRVLLLRSVGSSVPTPRGVVGASPALRRDQHGLLHRSGLGVPLGVTLAESREALPLAPPDAATRAVPNSLQGLLEQRAREIVGDETQPLEVALLIQQYFHDHYQYTLDVEFLADGEKAMEQFLREKRPAYCTYFASGMVLLLRARGIPARVVVGFLAHEIDPASNKRFVVRLRDAHAWTEAYLTVDGRAQWVRFDATPPTGLAATRESERGFGTLLDAGWRALRRWWALLMSEPLALVRGLLWPWGVLLGLALLGWINWRRRRAAAPRPLLAALEPHPLLPLYQRFEQALGLDTRAGSQTDQELLRQLEIAGDLRLSAASAFLSAYQAARFGAVCADVAPLERAIDALEQLI